MVVIHSDIDEIYYTFKNLDIGAEHTFLRVILPYPTDSKDYNLWVHGPKGASLNEITTDNEERYGFLAHFENLTSDISFRMTIPKDQVTITLYLNHSETDALEEIFKAEDERIEKSNNTLKALKIVKYAYIALTILYVFGSLLLLKYKQILIFGVYLLLGMVLISFNYLFDYKIIYLNFIILFPILIKLISRK